MGEIISRFEKVGMKIVGMKMVWVDKDFAKKHYKSHIEKKFYSGLEAMITEGPVVAMVLEGLHSIEAVRKMVGGTEPKTAQPGTIRGDYAHHSYEYTDKNLNFMKKITNKKFQTLTYAGFNKNDLIKFFIKEKLTGIDRIVPIGRSLEIGLKWDGFDIIRTLSRFVVFS